MIWRIKRLGHIKKYKEASCYPGYIKEADNIKLKLSKKEITEIIKKEKYEISINDFLITDIKYNIYLTKIKNTKEGIQNFIWDEHLKRIKQFKKLFWEEYVYTYCSISSYTQSFKEYKKNIKKLNKIKKILDNNKKYQGITGEDLQEKYNHKLEGLDINFSWRSWGSLMAAYINSKIEKRQYHYMSFYM